MVLSFGHITLNVTNLQRSKDFYLKFFREAKIVMESDTEVGIQSGDFSVWLVAETKDGQAMQGIATDQLVGMHHVAWKVNTLEQLQAWESYLREQQMELSKGGITDDDFGGTGIFLRDPDNIRLEIHLG